MPCPYSSNCLTHPAGPPFSHRNKFGFVHIFRSRQAYGKARVQRLFILLSAVEVASMITLMGWVRFCLQSPNSLAMRRAEGFA